MRPDLCWMYVSMLSVLVLCLNAEGEDSECTPEIKVKRHTVYIADQGDELRINCPFSFCEGIQPEVFWYKYKGRFIHMNTSRQSHIKTELKQLNKTEGISYLIFKNILRNDSGLVRCQIGITGSHTINISVSDINKFRTNSTDAELTEWLYVYSAAGIVMLVVIVIIVSVVAMRRCKGEALCRKKPAGKPKTEEQRESQYMAVPMAELPPPTAASGRKPLHLASIVDCAHCSKAPTATEGRGSATEVSYTQLDRKLKINRGDVVFSS